MLDIMQIPDPEAFMQSSRHFEESSIQYQGDLQTLSAGQSTLSESWEGDGATAYSQSHNQMQQIGEIHQQQRQQVAAMLSGTIAPLGEAKMLQDTAMSMMEESEMLTAQAAVEAVDPFTAPAAAATEAAATELAAQAQAMQASAQAIVQGVCANWQAVLGELMGSMQAGMDTGTLGGSDSSGDNSSSANSGNNNGGSGNGNSSGGNNGGGDNNKPPTGGSENPEDKPRQQTNDLNKLYEEAGPADQQLKAFATQFAEKTGGTPVLPGLKDKQTALKKIANDYNGDASYLLDIARGTIKYDTMEQVNAARAQIESDLQQFVPDAQIVRVKDRFANPTDSGYRDYLTNIRMPNGHIVELQIHLSSIEKAKPKEHELYEIVRDIKGQAQREGRPLTPQERSRIDELNAQSQEMYRKALEGRSAQ